MKSTFLFAALMAGGVLASCSKDAGENVDPILGAKTFASVSVTLNGASTRATDPNAVAEEIKINNVTLYVFNGGVLESTGDIAIDENNHGTKVIATTTGPKTIYAVANKAVSGAVGSLQTEFEQQVIAALDTDIAAENAFLMVGSTNQTLIEQTEDEALANPIDIEVTRAAAKVQLRYAENVPVNPSVNAEASQPKYTMVQQNTKMQLVRKDYALTPMGDTASQKDENGDSTCDHLVAYSDSNVWFDAVTEHNNLFAESFYLAENVNEEPVTGNTSFALVCLTIAPKSTADADGNFSDSPIAAGTTFYVIAKNDATVGGITFAAKDDKILYFANKSTAQSYLSANADLNGYEVLEYTDGKSYYRLNIRHITQSELTKKYCVLRNNYYKANITEINNLGFNTPQGTVPTEPTTPLDTQTFITADITVVDWTEVIMNEPLG